MSSIAPQIAERAVEWLVELQSPDASAETVQRWQDWRAIDPEHERAWQRIETFSQRLAPLTRTPQLAHAALGGQDVSTGRRKALKLLALLVASGASAWSIRDSAVLQDLRADYHSEVGEQRSITLADGSSLLLNTDSAVGVDFNPRQRLLTLLRGEIQLRTARDDLGRTLCVRTHHGQVETLDATFQLRTCDGFSQVTVSAGQLLVRPQQGSDSLNLSAGQKASFSLDRISPMQTLAESDQAWADGIIIARDQRLGDFLAELGRYRRGHLGCAKALENLRLSGTYPLRDTERVLDTLATTLGLQVRRFTRYWVTLEPRNTAV